MKIIVQFSGGKDSTASLIYAVKEMGFKKENIKAVFCDTKFEHETTYKYINEITDKLGVELITLSSKKYKDFFDLADKKKRFPSTKARFCTEELKTKPMIDYILDELKEHIIIVQGIRSDESYSRSKLDKHCTYFKYYTEPYRIKDNKPIFHSYRKKDVKIWKESFSDDIIRPFFTANANDVISYILSNGFKLNPLYYKGFSRVGCFPCIMARKQEVKLIAENYPEIIEKISEFETVKKHSFFTVGYIPDRFCSKSKINKKGQLVKFPNIKDVTKYVLDDPNQLDFNNELDIKKDRCMSIYNVCE